MRSTVSSGFGCECREREREIDNGRSNQRGATLSRAMTWSGYLAVVWMLFLFLTDHCVLFSLFFTILMTIIVKTYKLLLGSKLRGLTGHKQILLLQNS